MVALESRRTIDGKPLEPFALVDVEASDHVITVTADGFVAVEKQAKAVAGESQASRSS